MLIYCEYRCRCGETWDSKIDTVAEGDELDEQCPDCGKLNKPERTHVNSCRNCGVFIDEGNICTFCLMEQV